MTIREEVIMTREANRAQWAERVRAQRASGKSMTAFCQEHGIRSGTFFRWAKMLGGRRVALTAANRSEPRFARIEVVRPAVERSFVLIRLPGGVSIEGAQYPDPAWVRALISGLVEEGLR